MSDDRTPILVGAGQLTQRDVEPQEALEPLAMMAEVARRACADAGVSARLLERVDDLRVVNVFSWAYGNAPRLLAERLGMHPAHAVYTTLGGNTPQWLVNRTAARIAAGETRLALLVGAEAVRTVLRAQRAGIALGWAHGGGEPVIVGDTREGQSAHEAAHGMTLPVRIYPLFENALRAAAGRSLAEHQAHLGRLCARMAAVAADNPYAWFRDRPTAEQIATPSLTNRWVGFPYTKRMNAIIEVDQAAGVLLSSVDEARRLGIPQERWVYLWGCGEAHDRWFVSERVDYTTSPAIREAARQACEAADVAIGQIQHLELYSCFPSAVQISAAMLGLPPDEGRPLTLTGGLPYFGGPGNNYSMHGIAEAMARVRASRGSLALVTALGWYLTKHAVGIYGGTPPSRPFALADVAARQKLLDAAPAPELVERPPAGPATVETYTVVHDRDGAPHRGIVIGRLPDGRRFLANLPRERGLLEAFESRERIGTAGRVVAGDEVNLFEPAG